MCSEQAHPDHTHALMIRPIPSNCITQLDITFILIETSSQRRIHTLIPSVNVFKRPQAAIIPLPPSLTRGLRKLPPSQTYIRAVNGPAVMTTHVHLRYRRKLSFPSRLRVFIIYGQLKLHTATGQSISNPPHSHRGRPSMPQLPGSHPEAIMLHSAPRHRPLHVYSTV